MSDQNDNMPKVGTVDEIGTGGKPANSNPKPPSADTQDVIDAMTPKDDD
jgi:hypothetical protein